MRMPVMGNRDGFLLEVELDDATGACLAVHVKPGTKPCSYKILAGGQTVKEESKEGGASAVEITDAKLSALPAVNMLAADKELPAGLAIQCKVGQ